MLPPFKGITWHCSNFDWRWRNPSCSRPHGVTWGDTTLNSWHRCGQVEKHWISVTAIQTYDCRCQPLKLISARYTHLCFQLIVLSFLLQFLCPRLSHSRADTHHSPDFICSVFFGKTEGSDCVDGEDLEPRGSTQTRSSSVCRARCDKVGWCRQRERERKQESGATTIRTKEPRQEVHPLWGPK